MMSKFKLVLTLILVTLLVVATPVLAAPPLVMVDGRQLSFDEPPLVENGRILVPVRALCEAMGANVTWDLPHNTVVARKDDTTLIIPIGSTTPTVDGIAQNIDVATRAVNGRTLAPLRFVVEAFGGTVLWNQALETISIYSTAVNLPIGINEGDIVTIGQSYLTAEGFEIRVDGLLQNAAAWSILAAENPLIAPPPNDRQYVIVTCMVRNVSTAEEPECISDIDFQLIGNSSRTFYTYDKIVALPDEGTLRELRTTLSHGEQTVGSIAFYVPKDEDILILVWHPYFGSSAYFMVSG